MSICIKRQLICFNSSKEMKTLSLCDLIAESSLIDPAVKPQGDKFRLQDDRILAHIIHK